MCKAAFEFSNRRISDYYKMVSHRQLGKGRNSEVVFAFDIATGDHAAVKIINKSKARLSDRDFAAKEVVIRTSVRHPNLVQTLDIFESPRHMYIVMELMSGGSLDRRLSKQGAPLTETQAKLIMHRLFLALTHLHSKNIVHRNVKPQNVFVEVPDDSQWPCTCKLSDLSLACFLDDPDSSKQVVGTPEYLAPEASFMTRTADGERGVVFGTEVDIWAAGVTLYNLLSMQLPFEADFPPDVFKMARIGHLNFGKPFNALSSEALSLIRSLLNVDRQKRLTAQTALLHPWFKYTAADAKAMDYADDSLDTGDHFVPDYVSARKGHDDTGSCQGVKRLRAAAIAVLSVVTLSNRVPSIGDRVQSGTRKQFEFNVTGINLIPLEQAVGEAGKKEELDFCEMFDTVMSRVSTGSTVKSRSSTGTDPTLSGTELSERSDKSVDYIADEGRRQTNGIAVDCVPLIEVHRLMSDMGEMMVTGEDKGGRRKRWKGRDCKPV